MKVIYLSLILSISVCSSFAQSPERIFYSSFRPEGWDIYMMKEGTKKLEKLTEHPALDYDAVVSPDGKWVVFTSERDGYPRLYIKSTDKKESARMLIESESMQDQASISPDGKWIAFVSTHNGNAEIYKLPFLPDSLSVVEKALNLTKHPAGDFRPSFSPDGQQIVFSSDRDHPVKPHAFFSFAVNRTGDIFVMNSDGTKTKKLTNSESWDGSPIYSQDGKEILFYSERTGDARIWKMNPDGTGQVQINKKGPKTISPSYFGDNIICTSWEEDEGSFNLAILDPISGIVISKFEQEIDMLNPHSNSGLLVFHGGPKSLRQENNKGGFSGNLLVNHGSGMMNLEGNPVQTFGVRRAFAAPPNPYKPTLIIEELPMENVLNDINPTAYVAALLLIMLLIMALAGLVLAISKRKIIKPWRYLLYFLGTLILLGLAGFSFVYFLAIEGLPLKSFSLVMVGIALIFFVIMLFSYRSWKRRRKNNVPHYRVSKMFTISAGLALAFAVYTAMSIYWFFDVRHNFYEVNYVTDEVRHLFRIEPDININPANRQILDMKYSPDGSGFTLSLGSFGSAPNRQGDIYSYNFNSREVVRLTSSDHNDGFGGYSQDMKSFVFRSGRGGNMDLYLQNSDTIIQLTNTPAKENFPSISLQGDKIVYCTDAATTKRENNVKTMDIFMLKKEADGWSKPIQITTNQTLEAHPHFSPDGNWVIYTTEEFGIMDEQPILQHYIFSPQMYGEIVAQRLSDGKKIRITHNKWEDGAPIWERGINSENFLTQSSVFPPQ